MGEAELCEALRYELGERAEGAVDERGGELLAADFEEEIALLCSVGHGPRTLPHAAA